MSDIELTQLRKRFIGSPLFHLIPKTPEGSFEELALHALDYADEQKTEAERVDELYTTVLEQAKELKALLTRQVEFLRHTSLNKAERLERATKLEQELLEYKEI